MKNQSKIIQVFEHQTLKVDESSYFRKQHFKALSVYGYRNKEKFYSVGNERIKFSKYVGVIQVNNLTIEILPKVDDSKDTVASRKIWHDAFIGMLRVCRLIKLESISNAKLKLKSASILDLYFDAFLTCAERLVRQGLIKQYKSVSENLNKVKGKIKFSQHSRKNYLHKERFYVEHQTYDADNKFNQIVFKALEILSRISTNPQFITRIKKLSMDFDSVSEMNVTSSWFDSIVYNRNSVRYRDSITLAKLIILRYSPDLKGGNENVLAILFDMNRLFESYIYRKLKTLEYNPNIPNIRISEQVRRPFWESNYLKADILIECDSYSRNYVIDTKWKVPKKSTPSPGDIQQMFVYNLYYELYLSILLYPKTVYSTLEKKPFKNEYHERHCQIAFVDILEDDGSLNEDLGNDIYRDLLESELMGASVIAHFV